MIGAVARFQFPTWAKLVLCLAILLFIFLISWVYTLNKIGNVNQSLNYQHEILKQSDQLRDVLMRFYELQDMLYNDDTALNMPVSKLEGTLWQFRQEVGQYGALTRGEVQEILLSIDAIYAALTSQELPQQKLSPALKAEIAGRFADIYRNLSRIKIRLHEKSLQARNNAVAWMGQLSTSAFLILLSSVAAALALAIIIAFDIFIPMQNVTRRMISASQDIQNTDHYLLQTIRGGEIGAAQKALNKLLFNVAEGLREKRRIGLESRKRVAAIEAASDGIGTIDAQGNLTYMNRALMDLHGLQNEDLPDYINAPWEKLYSAKGQSDIRDIVMPLLRRQGFWRGESPIIRKNGEVVYAEMALTLLDDGGFIGTARDVTARKKIETEKDNLHRQFIQAQKMEAVGRLTGGIAHDFNNMLTVLDGNLDLIEDCAPQDREILKFVSAARNTINRCSELTRGLLAFSRRQVLTPSVANLNEIIASSIKLIERAIRGNVEILFTPHEDLWNTTIDTTQFESALLNLSINARDAMPGGGSITITTRNFRCSAADLPYEHMKPGEYVLITVKDTGQGIPPEILHRVFDPFFTTKEVGKGSGLGLSMVYGFVKQSEGYVYVDSKQEDGTCVSLYFPRSLAEIQRPEKSGKLAASSKSKASEIIMVVEDEPDLLSIITVTLERLNYQVKSATNGAEALLLMDDLAKLDLILTDIIMPGGIDGVEVAREAQAKFPAAKILYMSGYPRDSLDKDYAAKIQAELLQKPFTWQQLVQKIRDVLDNRSGS